MVSVNAEIALCMTLDEECVLIAVIISTSHQMELAGLIIGKISVVLSFCLCFSLLLVQQTFILSHMD